MKRKRQTAPVPSEKSSVGENIVSQVKAVSVKNLPKNITQDRLKELFEHHGKITKVVLPSSKVGPEKSIFGFVHFKKRSSAMKALKNTEKYEIDGQVLECSLAKPLADQKSQQPALLPTYPPPWLGYGLGGSAYGAGYGNAGFGQPMMHEPPPINYAGYGGAGSGQPMMHEPPPINYAGYGGAGSGQPMMHEPPPINYAGYGGAGSGQATTRSIAAAQAKAQVLEVQAVEELCMTADPVFVHDSYA